MNRSAMDRERFVNLGLFLLAPVVAIALAALVAGVVLTLTGADPFSVAGETFAYGTSHRSLVAVVNKSLGYYLAGIAAAIGFKMLLFNIGIDGQYRMAAFFAAVVGGAIVLPWPLHIILVVVVAMLVGGAWAAIAGLLNAYRGVSVVISTIMLNAIATGIIAWLLDPLRLAVQAPGSNNVTTAEIAESGHLPMLPTPIGQINSFVLVVIAVGVTYAIVLGRTRFGFELRASGMSLRAAQVGGVDSRRLIVTTMIMSGADAGLVGMPQLLGSSYHYGLDFPAGFGWTGIAIALLGRNHPIGIAIGALLWAWLERSAQILDLMGVSKEVVTIMQGVIVIAIVVAYELVHRITVRRQQRFVGLAERTSPGDGPTTAVSGV